MDASVDVRDDATVSLESQFSGTSLEQDLGTFSATSLEQDLGTDDEQEESIGDLLSGPKDSVTMFADTSRSRIQLDMSSGDDPLDVLAKEVNRRQSPLSKGSGTISALTLHPNITVCSVSEGGAASSSTPFVQHTEPKLEQSAEVSNSISSSATSPSCKRTDAHKQELAHRCRNDLHRELDHFLNDAAQRAMVSRAEYDILAQKFAIKAAEANTLMKENATLTQRFEASEEENRKTRHARNECQAQLEAARFEMSSLRNQISHLDQATREALATSCAGLDEANAKLSRTERRNEELERELRKLQGEREALGVSSVSDLAELAEVMTESLRRVQREQLRKFEQRNDEHMCVICLTERKNVVLQPCNHLSMCAGCYSRCSNACPQCRASVLGHVVVYM